jgi:hypothetical protein
MSKARPPKEIRQRRQEAKARKKQLTEPVRTSALGLLRLTLGRLWSFFVAVSIAVTLVGGGYFFFRPTLEILPPAPIATQSNDLFSSPFIVKNNSVWFSITDVRATCHTGRVWRDFNVREYDNTFYDLPVRTLEAGEEYSVPCDNGGVFPNTIRKAEVTLELEYKRPWFYLGHTSTHQGYQAVIRDDKAYWTPSQVPFRP